MATRKVLIIDDEPGIRRIAEISLKAIATWTVLTAASGQEGLAIARTEQPDAILLDVMLPDMDGVATFQQLQSNPATSHIPVVLLTAKVQASDQRRFAALGVKAMIAKPFKPAQLAEQLLSALT